MFDNLGVATGDVYFKLSISPPGSSQREGIRQQTVWVWSPTSPVSLQHLYTVFITERKIPAYSLNLDPSD